MFDSKKVAAAAKGAARAQLRAQKVLATSGKIFRISQSMKPLADRIAEFTKSIAVLTWEKEQAVSTGNPDAIAIGERVDEEVKRSNEAIDSLNKDIAGFQTQKDDLYANIKAVESGEKKMDYDTILELSNGFVTDATTAAFLAGEFDKETA